MSYRELISKYITPLAPVPTGLKPGGHLRSNIRCILFDLYGTLFISGAGDIGTATRHREVVPALKDLFRRHGIRSDHAVVTEKLHRSIDETHADMKRTGVDHPEVEIDRLWSEVLGIDDRSRARRFAVEYEWITNPVYPMPNAGKLIGYCRGRKIYMGIISNAQFFTPDLFPLFFDTDPVGLGFHPDLIFYSYQRDHAKPSLEMFRAAATALYRIGIPGEDVLYVGNDMLNDILPADRAGFQTALFAGDAKSLRLREDDDRCRDLSPDLIVTDLAQLLDFL